MEGVAHFHSSWYYPLKKCHLFFLKKPDLRKQRNQRASQAKRFSSQKITQSICIIFKLLFPCFQKTSKSLKLKMGKRRIISIVNITQTSFSWISSCPK